MHLKRRKIPSEQDHSCNHERDPERYRYIVERAAHKYARTILPRDPSLEMDDLIQDGWIWYSELVCQETNESGLAHSFEAMLTQHLEGWFLAKYESLTTHKRKRPTEQIDPEIAPSKYNWNKVEQYLSLSSEAQEIIKVFHKAPKELLDLIPSKGWLTPSRLIQYLFKVEHWDLSRIQKITVKTFGEQKAQDLIKQALGPSPGLANSCNI